MLQKCPICKAHSSTGKTCYADQKCCICLEQCARFAVLECGHLVCIDCAKELCINIIGKQPRKPWEYPRKYDGVTGKPYKIQHKNGKWYSIDGKLGLEALRAELEAEKTYYAKERRTFLEQHRARSNSPPAARGPVRTSTRSLSPLRTSDEAMMVEPNAVIALPWDATYAAAFNRGVINIIATANLERVAQLPATGVQTRRKHSKSKLNAMGSTVDSDDGVGRFKCAGFCGKKVMHINTYCDNCDDLVVEPTGVDDDDQDDVTDAEMLQIGVDTLGLV